MLSQQWTPCETADYPKMASGHETMLLNHTVNVDGQGRTVF
jgi:hypothetical protein